MGETLGLMREGGIFMYCILVTSFVAVAVILQRSYALWFGMRFNVAQYLQRVQQLIAAGEYGKAMQASSGKHPLQRMVNAGLMRANRSEKEIRRGVEATAVAELARFRGQTAALPQLSNLATLLGLLGTIRGLILSFNGMAGVDAAQRQAALSQGVAVAFYNTFFGLSVAMSTVVAYLILSTKQGSSLTKMDSALAIIIDQLSSPQQTKRARSSSELSSMET